MKKCLFIILAILSIFSIACTNKDLLVEENNVLQNEFQISHLNSKRPKIYIYSDFGGGKIRNGNISDLQTSQEIASAAWKSELQQVVYINDTAEPLSPISASFSLTKTFPYKKGKNIPLHSIVVHVIDPGVGNGGEEESDHRRSIVLRKDGFLFIGPDNGTLTYVCPSDSIARIWEIAPEKLYKISGIDIKAGGTFHGRDLFSEAAFRIASGKIEIDDIAEAYPKQDLQYRFSTKDQNNKPPISFEAVATNRFNLDISEQPDDNKLFSYAFLLGIIQSPLYQERADSFSLTEGKKIFLITQNANSKDNIAIFNKKTNNIYIGPDNGIATSFFKQFNKEDIKSRVISDDLLQQLPDEQNNEKLCEILFRDTDSTKVLKSIEFYGSEKELIRDSFARPKILRARAYIDSYGNIKTTALNTILDEARDKNAIQVHVRLNGIDKKAIFADTFFSVAEGEIFVYNGSSAVYGPNPYRSKRYVEVSSNGIYGKFGKDFFINKNLQPFDGQEIFFTFEYPE